MTNDDILTEAIRLIKAGNKDAAQLVLEPFLLNNPNHIQAWLWEAELFPNDRDKIKVLEACLKRNPGHPQVIQALTFLKNRSVSNNRPAVPASSTSPFSVPIQEKSNSSSPPFSTSTFLPDSVVPVPVSQQAATDIPSEKSSASQNAKLKKRSKRLSAQARNAIIVILALVALSAVIGLYLGGGFYLNGQINKSFAEQDCAGVVQQAYFVLIYPRGIFASMFNGYDQYIECRIKLDLEQAAAVKNWEVALARAQEYLTSYPKGSFAESMSEQAPNILFTWAEELIASHYYGNGIEKLKQLVETYPASQPAQPASEVILQAYILWSKELTDKQNYADAEQRLNTALAYFQADPARSDQVKQELANLYIGWGDMQIQLGDMDNGIKNYKKAGEIFPGKADIDLLIARAYLQQALDIGKTGNFDRALAKIKEISDATQAENIKYEANITREKILIAYSASNSQRAMDQMTAVINLTCQGERPELPIFGLNTEKVRFGLINLYMKLPTDWTAERPGELHYVICINDKKEEEIEICSYAGPTVGKVFLARMRYVWHVTIYDILNGNEYKSKTFKGSNPEECPPRANFLVGSTVSKSYGKRPAVDDVIAWLNELNIAK